jgi:hypothetical protein
MQEEILTLFSQNLERIKNLKKKTEELSFDYHDAMQRIKSYQFDLDYMTKKASTLDTKFEKLTASHKFEKI